MPYELVDPKPGRSPYYRIRGTEFQRYLDRSTKTSDKRTAQKLLLAERDEAKRLALSGPVKEVPTFASAALSYMHADGERRYLDPLLAHFGDKPLSDIDQAAIDRAAVMLYPTASAATRNRHVYTPVSAVLKRAGIEKVFRRPKGSRSTPRLHWLDESQAFRLLTGANAVSPRFGALVTTLLYCGCRLSDALSLDWRDVDLERATAFVRKTKNGDPVPLHLPPIVVAALANLPRGAGRGGRASGVFGSRTKNGRLYTWLEEAAQLGGVVIPDGIAFHILRHTHATWRRRKTGADTTALVGTGLWKSRQAAAVYEHLDPSEEARKSNLLPTPTRAKSVRTLGKARKT